MSACLLLERQQKVILRAACSAQGKGESPVELFPCMLTFFFLSVGGCLLGRWVAHLTVASLAQ